MSNLKEIISKNYKLKFPALMYNVLKWEKERVDKNFTKGSYFEDINDKFGIFPKTKLYPMYFYGNIENPKNKYVFVGINPSYTGGLEENEYLEEKESVAKYYHFLKNAFIWWNIKLDHKFLPYFNKISLYLSETENIKREEISYKWLQENVINLELIPYHSKSADGLLVNNIEEYYQTYFELFRKAIKHINPNKKIVFFGSSSFENIFVDNNIFNKDIIIEKNNSIYSGKIFGKYDFIVLPFRFSKNILSNQGRD
jgi:hypothetical protein